jgi:hypothetical protein
VVASAAATAFDKSHSAIQNHGGAVVVGAVRAGVTRRGASTAVFSTLWAPDAGPAPCSASM